MNRTTLLSSLLALVACGGSTPSEAPAPKAPKGKARPEAPKAEAPKPVAPPPAEAPIVAKGGDQPTVVFIVLDTVRADHLSLCDYDRPTSPFLASLVEERGFSHTCKAYSAATWTVPSHASYFTGLPVPDHASDSMGQTFGPDIPVLSELMRDKGYQSAMVSANPTLSKLSGLQRGFEIVEVAETLVDMRGERVRNNVRKVLMEADPDKPLFLFVNILDAHDPYPAIPKSAGWVPEQDVIKFDVHDKERDTPYHRFILGEMPEENATRYVDAITNAYDYGISEADEVLKQVLTVIKREGWLEGDHRILITSDHGEFLGEHQLLRHGCFTWEPVVNVPFLYFDSTRKRQLPLEAPFSATNAFWLARDGALPEAPHPAQAYSKRREFDVKVGADMATLWLDGGEKIYWKTDAYFRQDLTSDPAETSPTTLAADHPRRAELEDMARRHEAHLLEARGKEADPERVKQLEALGYVE